VLETKEKTLEYAKKILEAGASIITVHGRRREQKGHNTGLADWKIIRYLRDNLPEDTVIFANGNILQHGDVKECLDATGADGVMSAEGNLYDPTIFATPPPVGQEGREYWRGRDGKGGYRVDAVLRRYMDIIHKYALGQEPPARKPLFLPSEPEQSESPEKEEEEEEGPPRKKMRQSKPDKRQQKITNPNLTPMQAHLFHMLRPLVSQHHDVRDALAKSRTGDIAAFENVLSLVEKAVKEGLLAYEAEHSSEAPSNTTEPPSQPLLVVNVPGGYANLMCGRCLKRRLRRGRCSSVRRRRRDWRRRRPRRRLWVLCLKEGLKNRLWIRARRLPMGVR
jgi:tRNA-dihydrouridine synthase 1